MRKTQTLTFIKAAVKGFLAASLSIVPPIGLGKERKVVGGGFGSVSNKVECSGWLHCGAFHGRLPCPLQCRALSQGHMRI